MKNILTRKILSIVLAVVFVFGALPAFSVASFAASTDILSFELNDSKDGYIIYGNNITSGELVIPSEYEGLPVTKIGQSAFYNCWTLTEVTIPGTVTEIEESAFETCQHLTTVTMHEGVTEIGKRAFDFCQALTTVVIPESVTCIGEMAFSLCRSLVSVTIPESVTCIGTSAFATCESLVSVTIPDSVSEIGAGAFSQCSALTEVKLPENITRIKGSTFWWCKSLTSVTIPESVTYIGSSAFNACKSLASATIPASVTEISSNAFANCGEDLVINGYTYSAAHDYALASDIKFNSIGEADAFRYELNSDGNGYILSRCSALHAVGDFVIPSEYNGLPVTAIGNDVFKNYTELTSVTIPSSVKEIGSKAFYGCSGLTDVTIPGTVKEIGSKAFYGCSGLTDVTICDGVTEINDDAFCNCENLKSVTVPASVVYIGEYALGYKCSYNRNYEDYIYTKITDFTINGASYSVAHDYALENRITFNPNGIADPFRYELNLTEDGYVVSDCASAYAKGEIVIPSEYNGLPITEIGFGAFCGRTGITSVTIPDGINVIGEWAFEGCTKLTSVTIPDSVTQIGCEAFCGCKNLKSVTIPKSVTVIGEQAFGYDEMYYDWKTDEMYYPKTEGFVINGYTYSEAHDYAIENEMEFNSIGESEPVEFKLNEEKDGYILERCAIAYALGNYAVPSEYNGLPVTEIGYEAFKSCTGLTSVTLPYGVKTIGESAFENCTALTLVIIPNSVTYIGDFAFYNCSALGSATIPESVTEIGYIAFGYKKSPTDEYSSVKYDFIVYGYYDTAARKYASDYKFTFKKTTGTENVLYGDVNGDGQLTPSDVVLLRRYFANYDSENKTSAIEVFAGADVNGDGELTPSDVVLLRRYFANYDSDTGKSTIVLGVSA